MFEALVCKSLFWSQNNNLHPPPPPGNATMIYLFTIMCTDVHKWSIRKSRSNCTHRWISEDKKVVTKVNDKKFWEEPITCFPSQSQSLKSHYDQQPVGQSVLVSSPIWCPRLDFCYCMIAAVLVRWCALSEERTGLSLMQSESVAHVNYIYNFTCRHSSPVPCGTNCVQHYK
jgi:hypothetical protein